MIAVRSSDPDTNILGGREREGGGEGRGGKGRSGRGVEGRAGEGRERERRRRGGRPCSMTSFVIVLSQSLQCSNVQEMYFSCTKGVLLWRISVLCPVSIIRGRTAYTTLYQAIPSITIPLQTVHTASVSLHHTARRNTAHRRRLRGSNVIFINLWCVAFSTVELLNPDTLK